MKKNILNIILMFVIGGIAGVVFSNILLPKISNIGAFSNVGWLNNFKDQTIIINKTEEININELEVLNSIIEKNRLSEVNIKSFKNGKFLSFGSGFIVSSDGLIITRREAVSNIADKIIVTQDSEEFSAEIFKSLDDYGLVLLKSNISNLPVVSFVDSSLDVPLGSKVILIGRKKGSKGIIDFVNIGFIKSIDNSIFETTIKEDIIYSSGTPLLDLKGNVLGINFTNSAGYVFSVSSDIIKDFLY
jgi:S1-C subfamily serine protease